MNLKKMIMVRQLAKQHSLKSVLRKSRFKSTLHVCQLLEIRNMKSRPTPRGPTHRRCSINICFIPTRTMSNISEMSLVLKV